MGFQRIIFCHPRDSLLSRNAGIIYPLTIEFIAWRSKSWPINPGHHQKDIGQQPPFPPGHSDSAVVSRLVKSITSPQLFIPSKHLESYVTSQSKRLLASLSNYFLGRLICTLGASIKLGKIKPPIHCLWVF